MTTFPAGKYYIGDPCYVIANKNWGKLLEYTNYLNDGDFHYRRQLCHASGTAYGDGCYIDQKGRGYGVDSGLISIMPVSAMDINKKGKDGQIIEFTEDFNVDSHNGIFEFGDIIINTRGNDDWQ